MIINGNKYRTIKESGQALLMEGVSKGGSVFYEVWLKRLTQKEYTFLNGTIIPIGSLIKPSNENFSKFAWSFYNLCQAEAKFKSVQDGFSHDLGQKVVEVVENNNGLKTNM